MMDDEFSIAVENLVRKAPADWLTSTCDELRGFPTNASAEVVLQRLPATNNADLSFVMFEVLRLAAGKMSWEALSWTIGMVFVTYQRWQIEQRVELLWAGPAPAGRIPARRIDQALYDLIANAKREILLVTFAAAKIERLTGELWKAAQRGVKVRLILEFEESSEGQLSYDAMKAFPQPLLSATEIYHWPVEKRERNQAGRPGKLHAKIAIVDDCALVSSANLTDDAFNRNLELGVSVNSREFVGTVRAHFHSLITQATLSRLSSQQMHS